MMITLQEKLTQEKQEQWVLKEYDFYPERIEERDNLKIVHCDRGSFILMENKHPQQYLHWLADTMLQLKQEGFSSILPFYPNKYGDLFVVLDQRGYYVLPYVEDKVEEKYKESWEIETLRLLAELHQKTVSNSTNSCPLKPLSLHVLEKRWRKRLQKMEVYKEFAEKREIMSPFELAFVEKHEYLYKLGEKAIDYLQEWQEKYGESPSRYVLCHGHVLRKHVLHTNEGRYLLNFDRSNMDSPARELALYFRRHVDMSGEQGLELALAYLANYEERFSLTAAEKLLFAIFLLFPEHIFKEVEQYYEQAGDWSVLKRTAFFERQIKGTLTIRKFIRKLLD